MYPPMLMYKNYRLLKKAFLKITRKVFGPNKKDLNHLKVDMQAFYMGGINRFDFDSTRITSPSLQLPNLAETIILNNLFTTT